MSIMIKIKNGFSLVEVNLAIFVVSVGLLSLFTLFPAGLKEGEAGHADTQTSLFADYVMSTVRSEILEVEAGDWEGFSYGTILPPNVIECNNDKQVRSMPFPVGSKLHVRYYLDIVESSTGIYGVRLWIQSGEHGTKNLTTFKESSYMYYTELFFSGMP